MPQDNLGQLFGEDESSADDPNGVGYLNLDGHPVSGGTDLFAGVIECDKSDIARLRAIKEQFNAIESSDFSRVRSECNPFEEIGSGPFVNRSAMKLVNLNSAFCGLVERAQLCVLRGAADSEKADDKGAAVKIPHLNFVDLCGAPGGFSEFLLWRGRRKKQNTRGWGISLGVNNGDGNPCMWRVESSSLRDLCAKEVEEVEEVEDEQEVLSSFDICWGGDGSGDLYSSANIDHFAAHVLHALQRPPRPPSSKCSRASQSSCYIGGGVDLVVADGGFAAARNQHDQEGVMLRLVVAEILTALLVLAPGGSFVVKLFETRSEATAHLVHVLASSFQRVALVKPVTSRPASSEKYLVCEDFKLLPPTNSSSSDSSRANSSSGSSNSSQPTAKSTDDKSPATPPTSCWPNCLVPGDAIRAHVWDLHNALSCDQPLETTTAISTGGGGGVGDSGGCCGKTDGGDGGGSGKEGAAVGSPAFHAAVETAKKRGDQLIGGQFSVVTSFLRERNRRLLASQIKACQEILDAAAAAAAAAKGVAEAATAAAAYRTHTSTPYSSESSTSCGLLSAAKELKLTSTSQEVPLQLEGDSSACMQPPPPSVDLRGGQELLPKEPYWFYRDNAAEVSEHGPFSAQEMGCWCESGYFASPTLEVRWERGQNDDDGGEGEGDHCRAASPQEERGAFKPLVDLFALGTNPFASNTATNEFRSSRTDGRGGPHNDRRDRGLVELESSKQAHITHSGKKKRRRKRHGRGCGDGAQTESQKRHKSKSDDVVFRARKDRPGVGGGAVDALLSQWGIFN